MCTKQKLNIITSTVAEEAKRLLDDKLDAVILYGSYAHGDYDDESDIDIMVRIVTETEKLREYKHMFMHLASELSLEHDVDVSVTLADTESFNKYHKALPFYANVEREGVKIA